MLSSEMFNKIGNQNRELGRLFHMARTVKIPTHCGENLFRNRDLVLIAEKGRVLTLELLVCVSYR